MTENPFNQLGLKKETLQYLQGRGRLGAFLKDSYRIAQRHLHPDLGGDTGLSATVNAAYEQIQRQPHNVEFWLRTMQNGGHSEYVPPVREPRRAAGKWREASREKAPRERAEPRRREPKMPVAPIVLPDIVLYDAKGKPLRRYKTVTVGGEAERDKDDNYLSKTQDQWIKYYRETPNHLHSLPLVYAIIEKLRQEKHPAAAGLLTDLRESWLATSTRLDYKYDKIIHDYGLAPLELHCAIPEGDHELSDIKEKKSWKTVLQALLMPKDVEQAVEVLRDYSGVSPYLWTASKDTRRSAPLRAAFVYVYPDRLNLICNLNLHNYLARSRRVAVVE